MLTLASCGSSTTPPGQGTSTHADVLAGASAWLRGAAVPFDRVDPADTSTTSSRCAELVGDARIVSLGEATHGTREFFQMKHRILRFLVERMGFTAFAIEATWPEANRIDHYVRTGEGDPAVLLSGLYFWTWNTDEVLQMIQWMRQLQRVGRQRRVLRVRHAVPRDGHRQRGPVRGGSRPNRVGRVRAALRVPGEVRQRRDRPVAGVPLQRPDGPLPRRLPTGLRWVQDTLTSRQAPTRRPRRPWNGRARSRARAWRSSTRR